MSADPQVMQMLLAQRLLGSGPPQPGAAPQSGTPYQAPPGAYTGAMQGLGGAAQMAQKLMLIRALQQRGQQPGYQAPNVMGQLPGIQNPASLNPSGGPMMQDPSLFPGAPAQ